MLASFFADTKSIIKSRMGRDETGATAVEYGIMVALIAVVIIAAVTLLGGGLKGTFEQAQCSISGKTYTAATSTAASTCL
ncbi:pilus assembly protein Flp/PilA [Arthrobacter subterraneus]|uniref:Pilus assembly protein Flp/PilA n=1 Tax=Arthrobacter subterraneus TaxID=335973 RepID=A0A1G8CDM2_9MICC|nr:Flp family type IVb pilin [Arthrobacter subterraneus]SDH43597.1 pilus assembly protein Flp/PilA [Arthrobacter subterraneus]